MTMPRQISCGARYWQARGKRVGCLDFIEGSSDKENLANLRNFHKIRGFSEVFGVFWIDKKYRNSVQHWRTLHGHIIVFEPIFCMIKIFVHSDSSI